MKQFLSAATKAFVTLGKALMLPIAVLPIAGILLRLGQPDLLNISFLAKSGEAVFANLPAIFALGVAIGFAKDNHGAAPLSAYVGYVVLTGGLKVLNPAVDMGVFAGIIMGITAGLFYNKYHDINLPSYLAFFGGKRFVPIITGVTAVIIAFAASFIWPPVQDAINALGKWILSSKIVGLFIFGFANRLLIPLGLHHVLNNLVWFIFGNFEVVQNGVSTTYQGDIARFFNGDPTAGMFMSGFFPVMMFGLPAACAAMWATAKSYKRKAAAGILFSMAFTSFLTGITEPVEFSFMFLAFPLYVIHAILTGVSMVVTELLNVKLGFTFSAGAFDYILNWGRATNPARLFIIGPLYAAVYFVVFYYAIKLWDLKTPGREDEVIEVDLTKQESAQIAADLKKEAAAVVKHTRGAKYLAALGGKENIKVVDACATRLRLEVLDNSKIQDGVLKKLGAKGILRPGEGLVQVIIGPEADVIATEVRREM
ncbi:MAG: N-acetylglucosamine-specific PTS transporter subunit IIBC [Elusimicrobium sp.]|jgi:PTS system N-acetylglucosamine-specific IIC component|nr:N-acetylglucosamine-specific PTS transporter subunit IIBC [Elusimicrobium sp.]